MLISCSGTSTSDIEVIRIKGSDTMLKLTQRLGEEYSDINPNVKFQIYGGGTKSGIDEMIDGRIDICTASRNLSSSEAKRLAEYYGSIGIYYLIAKDAVSIYVNSNCLIKDISSSDLKKIFTCEINNLSQLDYEPGKIKLAIRDSDSGTREFLQDLVLDDKEFCSNAMVFSNTEEIIDFVKDNQHGFGFGGIGLAEGVKLLSIDGVSPNIQNAKNDKYPLTRYLHFFTSKSSSGNVKNFIDWTLSPDGQKIVKEEGFIPLWEINY